MCCFESVAVSLCIQTFTVNLYVQGAAGFCFFLNVIIWEAYG